MFAYVLLSALITTVLLPQDPHGKAESTTVGSGLTLRLTTGKDRFVSLEPVVLQYGVSNHTSVALRSRLRMSFETGGISVTIQRSGGNPEKFYSGPIGDSLLTEDVLHPPGSLATEAVSILYNDLTGGWAFPAPGVYALGAKMVAGIDGDKPVFLEADPVQITVEQPGEADQRVIQYLGGEERLEILLRRGAGAYCSEKPGASCFEELNRLIDQFSDSAYTPHIALDLASSVEWGGLEATPRFELVLDIVNRFLEKWKDHSLAVDAEAVRIRTLVRTGRGVDASRLLAEFEGKHQDRKSLIDQLRRAVGGQSD